MRKKYYSKALAIALFAALLLSAAGCAGNPAADGSDVTTIRITLSILYPESSGRENVEDFSMQIEEEATVIQIMESYSNQEEIPVQVSDTDPPQILSIGDSPANETSRWICLLNGDTDITEKISDYPLKDGDEIVWKFADM